MNFHFELVQPANYVKKWLYNQNKKWTSPVSFTEATSLCIAFLCPLGQFFSVCLHSCNSLNGGPSVLVVGTADALKKFFQGR